ncbi:hypothetical protein ET445_02445 [Agromyces protaetiae]|uniref:Uncharacterized protein n=1 Tax=Agromyces protaetiae TaxID=2509455 RepID=A0A4P6F9S8_9MICO|nr:hypothetical protein [Agromyces protaetiae]QAY72365.1 hypothetical protein ET445_02445 [Agromyces protaetiae]
MTEVRESIDPRFDARFQRGYDGGADASSATAPSSAAVTETDGPGDSPGPSDPLESLGHSDPIESPGPSVSVATVADPAVAAAGPGWEVSDEPERRVEASAGRGLSRAAAIRWFWIIAVVSLVCIVGGGWVSWTVNSDPTYYTGATPAGWAAMQRLQAFALPLAQAGISGLVGALLAWALFAPAKPAARLAAASSEGRS